MKCSQSSYPDTIEDESEDDKEKENDDYDIIGLKDDGKEGRREKEKDKEKEKKAIKGKGRGNGKGKGKERNLKTKISEINEKISKEEKDIDTVIKIEMNKTEALGRFKAAEQLRLLLFYLLENKNY